MSRKVKFTTEETLRILLDISSDGGSDSEEDNVINNDSNYESDAESVEGSLSGFEYEEESTENSSDNEPVPSTSRDLQPRKNFSKVFGVKELKLEIKRYLLKLIANITELFFKPTVIIINMTNILQKNIKNESIFTICEEYNFRCF